MPFGPQLGPPTGETASATPAPRAQRGFRPPPLSSPLGASIRDPSPRGFHEFDHQTSFVSVAASDFSSENEYEWTTPATSMAGASGRGSVAAPWDPPPRAPWPGLNEAQLSIAIAGGVGVGSMSGVAQSASSAGQANQTIDPLSPTSPSPFSPLAVPSRTAGVAARSQDSSGPRALSYGKTLGMASGTPFSIGSSQKSKTFPKSPGAGSSQSTKSSALQSKGTGLSSRSRAETTSTRNEEVKHTVGRCGYTLFYVVAFCVHWFGSLRFLPDHDSDDEFDPEDVQILVEQGSEWFRNFLVLPDKEDIEHQKSTAGAAKGTLSTPYSSGTPYGSSLNDSVNSDGTFEQAHHASDGGVSTGNPGPINLGFRSNQPPHLGLDSGAGAFDSDERKIFGSLPTGPATSSSESRQIFMSQGTAEDNNVYVEKIIRKRLKQHPPYFVCCEAVVIFALWFIFALQTSHYDVVGRAILYEESDLLPVSPNLWIGDKSVKDCEDACNEQDACQGVAYFDGPTSTCALLQNVREGSCETNCNGLIGWQLLKRTSKSIEARMSQIAGLDNIFPEATLLQAHDRFCNSFENQLWRWWTYQFTHGKISHVLENALYILIFGPSLEGLQGPFRLFLMFNLGVISGGLWCVVFDSHSVVIGASGGCYALIGIHVAVLIMNWHQFKFKAPTLLVIAVTFTASFVSYIIDQEMDSRTSNSKIANSTHLGGFVGGLAIGILWVTNIKVTNMERAFKLCIGLTFSILVMTCLCWFFTNPFPATRNAFFGTGDIADYCWLGYACVPPQYGGNCGSAFECVSCATKECVAQWYANTTQFQVGTFTSYHSCGQLAHLDLDPSSFLR